MKISNGRIILSDAQSYSPSLDFIDYVDINNNKISIPLKLVIRLYEGTKQRVEYAGHNWEEITKNLFQEYKETGIIKKDEKDV